MKLADQIEAYKLKHGKGDHTFNNGDKCQQLHKFLDGYYQQAVQEFKNEGTKNNANAILKLL